MLVDVKTLVTRKRPHPNRAVSRAGHQHFAFIPNLHAVDRLRVTCESCELLPGLDVEDEDAPFFTAVEHDISEELQAVHRLRLEALDEQPALKVPHFDRTVVRPAHNCRASAVDASHPVCVAL
eukprot:768683-Hanusia_phi.AAC.5